MKNIIPLLAVTALAVSIPVHAAPVLTVTPASGTISGLQGSTVGWGFTITNTVNYLEVTSSEFCSNPVSLPFCSASTVGTYTDIVGSESNPVIVGPSPESSSVTQAFNNSAQTGFGAFKIAATAANGATDSGQLVLTYDLFSVSPNDGNFDPGADTISTDNFLKANATINVNPAVPTVPEPGSFGFLVLALGGLGCMRFGQLRFRT